MSAFRFPRTLHGWRTLFWIARHRCPDCHRPLSIDWPQYDDGVSAWCLPCGGWRLPRGVIVALRWNARAHAEDQRKSSAAER
ncbi:MAG: hypothetical protein MI806_25885 [Minwuiales bacterium]|nr:hypothetical protein [Minwuiales bacterium]